MQIRYLLFFILFFVSSVSLAQQKKNTVKKTAPKKTAKGDIHSKPQNKITDTDTVLLSSKADSIVVFAKSYLGIKYRYGGQDTNGFDCAGFVCFVYKHFGVKLPRSADAQALLGKEVTRKTMRPGDLVYFKGRDIRNKAVGHVGIVIENNEGKIKFISATVNAGIHIDDIDGTYWKERYISAKRILIENSNENKRKATKDN